MELKDAFNTNPELPQYLYYGQFERTNELDQRIYERNISDINLTPNFSIRGTNTRQNVFPIITTANNHAPKIPIQKNPTYDSTKVFSPIQKQGPINSYLQKINEESMLRNQCFALQHGCIESTYIPSSTSDLYKVNVPKNSNLQQFPNLFEHLNKKPTEPYHTTMNTDVINGTGKLFFNNATKQQLRNL
jgi:hypothetical protein